MVSSLWSACSEGNIETVLTLLNEAPPVDIEIKDLNGTTPLLEAVKKGHVAVVEALLDKGADPCVVTAHGGPEVFTSDLKIIDLVKSASAKTTSNEVSPQDQSYPLDPNADPPKPLYPAMYPHPFYGPPNGYLSPPVDQYGTMQASWNLPPREVARFIQCRYYPACRYGSSCIFSHTPLFQGPPPYPAVYDSMAQQQYPPGYYYAPPPLPTYSLPNTVSSSPGPPHTPHHPAMVPAASGSEALPSAQASFTPNGAPPAPYGPMSPVLPYPPPPHPLSIPTMPPPQQPATAPGPQSPQPMYPSGPVSASPFSVRQDPSPYPHAPHPSSAYPETNGTSKSPPMHAQGDSYGPPPFRPGMTHPRRGNMRRGQYGNNRKPVPACLFFPAGRCRNGDECRFPHVIPDASGPQPQGGRGPRPRDVPNGISTIEEKISALSVRDDAAGRNGATTDSSRSHSTDPGSRRGTKFNGTRVDKKPAAKQQRVPNADEFPVLSGLTSSKAPINGVTLNGTTGPTAAQVLQAPPPVRKESVKESITRSASPEEHQTKTQAESRPTESNGAHVTTGAVGLVPSKLPISFAAAATATTTTPDMAKEVSVPA